MICTYYQINNRDRDIPRYFKLHLDHGLEMINADVEDNPNLVGYDYLFNKIHEGLNKV